MNHETCYQRAQVSIIVETCPIHEDPISELKQKRLNALKAACGLLQSPYMLTMLLTRHNFNAAAFFGVFVAFDFFLSRGRFRLVIDKLKISRIGLITCASTDFNDTSVTTLTLLETVFQISCQQRHRLFVRK